MPPPTFAPGFRFSSLDALILVAGAVAAGVVAMSDVWLAVVVAWVVLHFFAFCNVLRMARARELVWAAGFVVAAGLALAELVAWPITLGASLVLTVFVTIVELRQPSYHGVGWQHINPDLPQWWERRHQKATPVAEPE